jgi:photosystem II stability/assembly factor-like uncharacterized protein
MKKQLFKTIISLFVFSATFAQEEWQLLNPRPSSATGLDIEFVSDSKGYYITTNELFYTLDSGESWSLKRNISGARDMSFKNDFGIIVGTLGTVLKSEDSGESWTAINLQTTESLNTVSIIDENTLVISGNNSVYISTDKGLNWQQKDIPSYRVNKTFFLSASVGHAVTDNGEIFKTTDGGENWTTTASFTNYAPNSFFTIFFKNENVGFATREHNEFYKTIDGGDTWQAINDGISHAIFSFQFINDKIGFGAGEYGTYKTINGGDTWVRIPVDQSYWENTDVHGIFFFDENKGFSVGQRGRIAKTEDSGLTWQLYSPIENTVKQIEFTSSNTGIALVGNDIYKTTDAGISWDYQGNPDHYEYTNGIDFVNENIGYSYGGGTTSVAGSVYKTTDGGVTWNLTNGGRVVHQHGLASMEFVNENLGFVSGGFNQKRLFKTTDGGEVWRVVLQQTMGQIQFLNADVGYARRIGYSTDIVYKTIDGGENWVEIFSSELDIGAFYFIDPELGYIVGDDGLAYKTIDGGDTWIELDLPYLDFEHLVFHTELIGYAVDDYGVILKTENGGYTWSQIYQNYGLNDIIITTGDEIFIAGNYGRILKSQVITEDVSMVVNEATNITASSADIEAVIAANDAAASDIYLEYGENGSFSNAIVLNPNSVDMGTLSTFQTSISELKANTTYSYRVIANSNGTSVVSNIKEFTTLPNYTLNMNWVYDPGTDSASVSGSVTSNNGTITAIGFEYGITPNSFSNTVDGTPSSVTGTGMTVNVESVLENLDEETTYYVRIKAEYNGEVIYSNPITFTTKPNYRIVSYGPIIEDDQATITALLFAYKDDLTEIVIEYGEQEFTNEIIVSPNTITVSESGNISAIITALASDKIYYYRIRAKQGTDTIYGPEGIFSISENVVLLVDKDQSIYRESAILTGRVYTKSGYLSPIQIEYGISTDYGLTAYTSPGFSSAGATTPINGQIGNLMPNTMYNYRIKAVKDNVEYYSENATFTTLEALPLDNFKIIVSSETCIDKNNGILQIKTEVPSDYIATIGFDQYNFTDNLLVENLIPGTYDFCIRENGAVKSQCFQFVINESEQISGKTNLESDIQGKQLKVNMDKGTLPYSVSVNNKSIGEFNSRNFSFNVQDGDAIEIVSKYECEGKIALEIQNEIFGDSFVNPINSVIDLIVEEQNTHVLLELYDLQGSLLKSFRENITNHHIELNIENYPSGVYIIKIYGNTIRTHKIIKR